MYTFIFVVLYNELLRDELIYFYDRYTNYEIYNLLSHVLDNSNFFHLFSYIQLSWSHLC